MLSEQTPTSTGYWAGRTGAALRDEGDHARLWLGGEDRIPFLQRISTNDVRLLPGQGTVTVLTSPTARIQAVLTVLAMPADLLLLAGPGQGPALFNTLRTQIFFNDQVTLEGRGGALAQFNLLGPQAASLLGQVGSHVDDLPLFGWRTLPIAGVDVTVQRHEGLGSAGFTLLAPAPASLAVKAALLQAGAAPLNEAAYHTLRIEAGMPAPGSELSEQVNPLEAGLRRFCHERKGCYTGQEIIARAHYRGQVKRRMRRFAVDAGELPLPGAIHRTRDGLEVRVVRSARRAGGEGELLGVAPLDQASVDERPLPYAWPGH